MLVISGRTCPREKLSVCVSFLSPNKICVGNSLNFSLNFSLSTKGKVKGFPLARNSLMTESRTQLQNARYQKVLLPVKGICHLSCILEHQYWITLTLYASVLMHRLDNESSDSEESSLGAGDSNSSTWSKSTSSSDSFSSLDGTGRIDFTFVIIEIIQVTTQLYGCMHGNWHGGQYYSMGGKDFD